MKEATAELQALDAASRDSHAWAAFKHRIKVSVAAKVEGLLARNDEETVVALRHIHDVVYVADRIRKAAVRGRTPMPPSLRQAAERLLSKTNAQSKGVGARSAEEERYAVGARVSWHKLIQRQGKRGHATSETMGPKLRDVVQQRLHDLLLLIDRGATEDPEGSLELEPLAQCLRDCSRSLGAQ